MPIYELSATEIIKRIRHKEISCVEVARAFITRIQQVNPVINALHQFDPERILEDAKQRDRDIAEGKKLGKLHGLPISLKDSCYVPGFRCAKGIVDLYKLPINDKAATAVQRILDEGAIVLGLTNVPEFLSAYESDNLIHGRSNNPYDLSRTPGGSSGGEAALIAAGGSCLGLGSDAGGSIRVPAHYSGIAGLKPTKGLVPRTGFIPNDSAGIINDLATYGPMARHVEDLELLLDIIAGPDNHDPSIVPMPIIPSSTVNVQTLKVIYFLDNGLMAPDAETSKALTTAIEKLNSQVASMQAIAAPAILKETYKLVWDLCFLGGNQGQLLSKALAQAGLTEFSPLFKRFLQSTQQSCFDTQEFHSRLTQINDYKQTLLALMAEADILLCPVTATPARPHGTTHDHIPEFSYAQTFNLLGWPAASINCGFTQTGLPIGLQIAAKNWDDHKVLAFAKQAQTVLGVPPVITPK